MSTTNDTQWRECIRTIVLHPHVNGPANPDNRKRLERMMYLYGFSEPNYPVPAIYDPRNCYDYQVYRWKFAARYET